MLSEIIFYCEKRLSCNYVLFCNQRWLVIVVVADVVAVDVAVDVAVAVVVAVVEDGIGEKWLCIKTFWRKMTKK